MALHDNKLLCFLPKMNQDKWTNLSAAKHISYLKLLTFQILNLIIQFLIFFKHTVIILSSIYQAFEI